MPNNLKVPEIPEYAVSAFPTKKFFMSMLTRDIALNDAIMDLLDNCIDGILRQLKGKVVNPLKPYDGFFGEINIDESYFTLKDNCGGIPLKTAIQYAFKMGRSEEYHDDDNLETVGMYGIGMKRAIFKMGLEAEIFPFMQKISLRCISPLIGLKYLNGFLNTLLSQKKNYSLYCLQKEPLLKLVSTPKY